MKPSDAAMRTEGLAVAFCEAGCAQPPGGPAPTGPLWWSRAVSSRINQDNQRALDSLRMVALAQDLRQTRPRAALGDIAVLATVAAGMTVPVHERPFARMEAKLQAALAQAAALRQRIEAAKRPPGTRVPLSRSRPF